MIKIRTNTTKKQELAQEENQSIEESFPNSDELVARAKLSIPINKALEEYIILGNELKEIYDLGGKAEEIMFKKIDFMKLNATAWKKQQQGIKVDRRYNRYLILLKLTALLLLAVSGSPEN